MVAKVQSIRGMNDVLPEQAATWAHVAQVLEAVCHAYGYREIRPPLLERTELFKRSIGEQTDIVEKEMYTFIDNNGESLTLRPEATASCVRAGIEHGLFHNRQAKLWYLGAMFRHEKPQKGRYRQFHQFGIEAVGWPGPDVDAELQMFAARLFRALGIESVALEMNTLGSDACRGRYRDALRTYLRQHESALDEDSRRRLERNPLRVLDSKDPGTRDVLENAPRLADYLDDCAADHFERICARLRAADIPFTVNDRLVRGLDYYTSTVFEWTTDKLGAQSAVCAGGRYDGLVEQLGGRPTPSAGFAIGIERLIELHLAEGTGAGPRHPDVYIAALGEAAELLAVRIGETLRDAGIDVAQNLGGGGFKKQLKRADLSGARAAIIIGEDEVRDSTMSIKSLRSDAEQIRIPASGVVDCIHDILAAPAVASTN